MTKTFIDFIDYIQTAQRAALTMESVERFDVNLRNDRCSIWITRRKDRANSSYFYDVVDNYTTTEKIDEIKKKLADYFEEGSKLISLNK
jgi:hypothetical protein